MMKRKVVWLICALAVLLLCSAIPNKAQAATYSDLTYEISNGEVVITDCDTSASGEMVIPDSIDGYPVTAIGDSAFDSCGGLTSVMIPDSVASIGDFAFNNCWSLSSVSISSCVTSISDWVFAECSSLTSVMIPDGVTSIGEGAFIQCGGLTSVTIPDGVTSIGDEAFYYCSSLTSVTIPASVTIIGKDAFSWCHSLTGMWVSNNNSSYSSDSCGVLFNKDKTILLQAPAAISGNYTIPNNVITIFEDAFAYCSGLTSVTFSDSVTSVGRDAFFGCRGLISVSIPDSLTSIGANTFVYCDSLTDVYYSGTAAQWAQIAIGTGNDSLLNATIHPIIGPAIIAFGNCGDNLTWLLDQEGTLGISGTGAMTDWNFSNLPPWFYTNAVIQKVVIDNGVTSIGACAFSDYANLTSVTIPDSVNSIGDWAFAYCSGLTSVTIPDGVTSISDYVFHSCSSLTSVTIPDSVNSIGRWAFLDCFSLRYIMIPDGVTSIGEGTFIGCIDLTSVTIPKSVTSIGESAFYSCSSLKCVIYCGKEEQWDAIGIGIDNEDLTAAERKYHDYADATCITPKTCTICGETEGGILGHTIGTDGCTLCGAFNTYHWVLNADATVEVSLTQDLYVDLNGYDLSGTVTLNGYKIYGMDSTTDGYTCDEMGYFSCVDVDGNAIVPESHFKGSTETIGSVKRYMTISTERGYTFHRFYLGVTHASIKPGASGVGYKAVFAGDEMVQAAIESYGYSLRLDGFEPVTAEKAGSPVSGKAFTVRINRFDVDTYGETPLTAQVHITVNGETISASAYTTTLKAMVQAVDADASQYTATQLAALKAWLGECVLPKSWNLTNI